MGESHVDVEFGHRAGSVIAELMGKFQFLRPLLAVGIQGAVGYRDFIQTVGLVVGVPEIEIGLPEGLSACSELADFIRQRDYAIRATALVPCYSAQWRRQIDLAAEHGIERIDILAPVSDYLLKDSSCEQITSALHQVHDGLCPIAPALTRQLVAEYAELSRRNRASILTDREKEILKLVANGTKSTEISNHLFISLSTVKREIGNIFDKLGVNDRPHAVSEAMSRGLI